ncbi:MAG: DUF4836 family protein [Muribaculaceae bacterium]|nr:DUF4836 family protein [Muribaculaceae bacterium]
MKIMRFHYLFTFLLIFSLGLLGGCQSEKTDMSEILGTVPADASAVITVNLHNLIEKGGGKIEGSKILPGKDIEDMMKRAVADSVSNRNIRAIFNGETGIDPSVAVFFIEGMEQYVTGYLADPEKFKEYVKNETGYPFTDENGVERSGNMAVKGNQFWIHANHNNDINSDDIARFAGLSEKLSFMNNPYAKHLASAEQDISGWASLNCIYGMADMTFATRTLVAMGMALVFTDAQSVNFDANFGKGEFTTTLSLLDSKCNPARFNLPVDRIDVGLVKNLSQSGDMIIAMAIPERLVTEIEKGLKDKNVPGVDLLMQSLGAIDGTCVFELGEDGMKGTLTTKGEGTVNLSDMLNEMFDANVTKDGKILHFAKGDEVSGAIINEKVADAFRGAMFGMVVSPDASPSSQIFKMHMRDMVTVMSPKEGSMELKATVSSDNEKENFLLTMVKSM